MKALVSINVILVLFVAYLSYSHFSSLRKIVFVNTGDVFKAFQMTKEMDIEIKAIEEKKQSILDSLANNLKKIQAGVVKIEEKDFDFLKRDFIEKRNQFAEDISKLKQTSIEKIWTQINQYVADYGRENGVDIILGANGQGSLMYAKEKIDVSKDIINYVNQKYSGVK